MSTKPGQLQAWLDHKRIDETMLYVHVAENHRRDLPPLVLAAASNEIDPDRRILRMLGARGSEVAATLPNRTNNQMIAAT